jgi:hypothetical protein
MKGKGTMKKIVRMPINYDQRKMNELNNKGYLPNYVHGRYLLFDIENISEVGDDDHVVFADLIKDNGKEKKDTKICELSFKLKELERILNEIKKSI